MRKSRPAQTGGRSEPDSGRSYDLGHQRARASGRHQHRPGRRALSSLPLLFVVDPASFYGRVDLVAIEAVATADFVSRDRPAPDQLVERGLRSFEVPRKFVQIKPSSQPASLRINLDNIRQYRRSRKFTTVKN